MKRFAASTRMDFRATERIIGALARCFSIIFFAARGLVKTGRPLEWTNEAVLGRGFKKIMGLYRHDPGGIAHS
jgi:hypothetical protein